MSALPESKPSNKTSTRQLNSRSIDLKKINQNKKPPQAEKSRA